MLDYLSLIAEGRNRCDVTPVFADAGAFRTLVDDLVELARPFEHDLVAGIDALGFILGGAIAIRETKGFVAIRKGGKLPVDADRREFLDYSGNAKSLELRHQAFAAGTRLLLVDEWIETGAQVRAAAELLAGQFGVVTAIACINCDTNAHTDTFTSSVSHPADNESGMNYFFEVPGGARVASTWRINPS